MPLFDHNDRARGVVAQYVGSGSPDEYEDGSVQLACSVAPMGRYTLATIATFLVSQNASSPAGDEEEMEYDFTLLNGYLRIV